MNKRLLVLAVASTFGASGAAFAHGDDKIGLSVNGHAETSFYITDDAGDNGTTNETERKFHTEGEVSFGAKIAEDLYGRVDLDLNSRYSPEEETVEIEQMFGAWRINDMATVKIGRFNNPLGYEKQDAPNKSTYSRSLISDVLDFSTELYQNNIEGVAVGLNAGPAKITLAALNDIGGVDEENSFLAHVRGEVVPGLNLALGVLTQDAGFENLINFNADYTLDLGTIATTFFVDYLTASEALDNAYSVGAKLKLNDVVGLTLRYDMAELDGNFGNAETTAFTVGANWQATSNLDLRLEWRNQDSEFGLGFDALGDPILSPANSDDDSVVLSAVVRF